MDRERFLVKSTGDNIEGVRAGLVKLLESLPEKSQAVIVVPTMKSAKDTLLVDVLGEPLAKKLLADREISLDGERTIYLCAEATLKNYMYFDAYLALWGGEHMISKIEDLKLWKIMILVTWLPDEATKWVAGKKVQVIFDDGKS